MSRACVVVCFCLRWNELKLKELRDEEMTGAYRQRAGRWVKWREMTEAAAATVSSKIKIPSGLEMLGIPRSCFVLFIFVYSVL